MFLALGVGALAAAWAVVTQERAAARLREEVLPLVDPMNGQTRAVTVARAMKALKLVTVELDTFIEVKRGQESWRGDVVASIVVPVRLSYGTDLSGLDATRVSISALPGAGGAAGACLVRVPRPTRVATEVFGEQEKADVQAGWMRLRSRAGEYYLGIARKDAAEAARALVLKPADREMVEQTTKEQVAALARAILGDDYGVVVVFDEPAGGAL